MDRRAFIKTATLGTSALAMAPRLTRGARPGPHVGVQISPQNLFDEGVERTLDQLQALGAVNTLYLLAYAYYGASRRPPELLADHGVPRRDERERSLPRVWLRTHEDFYRDTNLRHQPNREEFEYGDRDPFLELRAPLEARGMKIIARWYEPSSLGQVLVNGSPSIRNWEQVLVVDVDGARGSAPCWNHPNYRAWIRATVLDVLTHYDVDGIQYGAERVGPLSRMLFGRRGKPACFCEHCIAANRKRGYDVKWARRGYRALYETMQALMGGAQAPNGTITTLLGLFQQFPEILGWNYQWLQADNEIQRMVFDAARSVKPDAEVVRHVDHQRSSWDIVYRAAVPYADMEGTCDWIKPILYHRVFGPRLRRWKLEREHAGLTRELTLPQSLDLFYALFQYERATYPGWEALDAGMPPDYVYLETKRAVAGTGGRVPVASGIGLDVPFGGAPCPADPEETYRATRLAFQAGARGVVASREYEEMRFSSLKAFGDAVREEAQG